MIFGKCLQTLNASLGGTDNKKLNEEILKVQDHGTVFVTSGENDGNKSTKGYAKSNVWISIAAVHLEVKWNEEKREVIISQKNECS